MVPKVPAYDWYCPYCGHGDNNENDRYLGEGCHSITCGMCEKDYVVCVRVSFTFEAFKEVDGD